MSNFQHIRVFAANIIWFLSCLPGLMTFLFSLRTVRSTQQRVLSGILCRNKTTRFGQENNIRTTALDKNFENIKIRNYEEFEPYINKIIEGKPDILTTEPITLLEPTSGSTSPSKFIPYTNKLQKEFQAAIDPWIAGLYLNWPALLNGCHYWAISPHTELAFKRKDGGPPIGFKDDTDYLNPLQKWVTNTLFPVPAAVRKITDQGVWEYCTLLFLVRCKNVRLISVWHPSFLTILMEKLENCFPTLIKDIQNGTINPQLNIEKQLRNELSRHINPDPHRAKELARIDKKSGHLTKKIWPKLCLISCWADGQARHAILKLRHIFPQVVLQPKGLIATEGIISFPLGKHHCCVGAVRSHFYEFKDKKDGTIKRLWELKKGEEYRVILTTGGGLFRYCLNDIVRVDGFMAKTPCLTFISRDGYVSDWVGEKLNPYHVTKILNTLKVEWSIVFDFFMIAPTTKTEKLAYAAFIKPISGIDYKYQNIQDVIEEKLSDNFHYQHARNLSQLGPFRLFIISSENPRECYINFYVELGRRRGDIKQSILEKRTGWEDVFEGDFFSMTSKIFGQT